jgi:hypothetical protein
MPNPGHFIDDDIFEKQTITGKDGLGLFSAEAGVLRTELIKILSARSSAENWDFVHAVREINSQKNATEDEVKSKLNAIYERFIRNDAPDQINLSGEISKDITTKYLTFTLTPNDLTSAIQMIFADSIIGNLTSDDLKHFSNCEKMVNAANAIAKDLTVIMQSTRGESKIRFLDKSPPVAELEQLRAINDAAKTTQTAMFSLLNKGNITRDEFKDESAAALAQFSQTVNSAVAKLEKVKGKNEGRLANIKSTTSALEEKCIAAGIPQNPPTQQHKQKLTR